MPLLVQRQAGWSPVGSKLPCLTFPRTHPARMPANKCPWRAASSVPALTTMMIYRNVVREGPTKYALDQFKKRSFNHVTQDVISARLQRTEWRVHRPLIDPRLRWSHGRGVRDALNGTLSAILGTRNRAPSSLTRRFLPHRSARRSSTT